ncbi:MAG TPA: DUF4149 domain-containing protein [Terriglobales bacterium]|nr:DUF4149 domain-containing protein [Terriglobales bacterium]
MSFLRFLMLLALVVWLGGIVFFAVMAPNVFAAVPTREMAGHIIARLLTLLHGMGIAAGIVFLVCSLLLARLSRGAFQPWAARNLLVAAMLALTCISQFYVFARMESLRRDLGGIDRVAPSDPRRVEFDRLHVWSTRLEGGVLLLGLGVVFSVARRLS